MKQLCLIIMALALATVTHAQSVTGTGGVLTAPTSTKAPYGSIELAGINLTNGGTAQLSCPIVFFGEGPYQWNWFCGEGGYLTVDHIRVAIFDPNPYTQTMTYTCSGGGRGNPYHCIYAFSAALLPMGQAQFTFSTASGDVGFNATY